MKCTHKTGRGNRSGAPLLLPAHAAARTERPLAAWCGGTRYRSMRLAQVAVGQLQPHASERDYPAYATDRAASASPTPSQSYPTSYQPYRMHSPPRSAFVRSYANPPPVPTESKMDKESTTVTKVADLLNNDDSADTSQAGNWESWFN